jgi:acyl phosphate:glycerol-3-phosphate acyltransferase
VPVLGYTILALCAYLLGSIPTGYLVARARGIDIRTMGSGNIGATNAFRVLGRPAGVFVLIVDGLKGYAACTWMADVLLRAFDLPLEHAVTERAVAGFCAILGHTFTCWLRFKGGKGIATSAGVYFAVALPAAAIAVAAWIILLVATRFVSVASIVAAVALPAGVWFTIGTHRSVALGIATTALGAMVIWKHKGNIARLKAGTENRIEFGRKPLAGGNQ